MKNELKPKITCQKVFLYEIWSVPPEAEEQFKVKKSALKRYFYTKYGVLRVLKNELKSKFCGQWVFLYEIWTCTAGNIKVELRPNPTSPQRIFIRNMEGVPRMLKNELKPKISGQKVFLYEIWTCYSGLYVKISRPSRPFLYKHSPKR